MNRTVLHLSAFVGIALCSFFGVSDGSIMADSPAAPSRNGLFDPGAMMAGGSENQSAAVGQLSTSGRFDAAGRTVINSADAHSVAAASFSPQISFIAVSGAADSENATAVRQTADGGYIVTGNTRSSGAGGIDLILMKYDATGALTWASTVGGSDSDGGRDVQQTADGGYIAAGVTRSFGAGGDDVFLVKFDAVGTVEWARTAGGSSTDVAAAVQQTLDGGYIVVGETHSFGAGDVDIFLLKYDENGGLTWVRTAGGSDRDAGFAIAQTADNGYIVAGATKSFGAGSADAALLKYDADGNLLWSKTIGGSADDGAYGIGLTSDNGCILVGASNSFGVGMGDALVLKFDAAGAYEWAVTAGGVNNDEAFSVKQTADNGYIIGGSTGSFGAGGWDMMLLKLSAGGNLQWAAATGGLNDEFGYAVQITSDGGYMFAGSTESFGAGGSDALLLKTDSDGLVDNCSVTVAFAPVMNSPAITVGAVSFLTTIPTVTTESPTVASAPAAFITTSPCVAACDLGVELSMPAHEFTGGSFCSLAALLCNPGPQPLTNVNLFVFLDTGIGEYWFAPSWNHYPPDLDYYPLANLPLGATEMSIIPVFDWPENVGSLSGFTFFGALTDEGITQLIGNLGSWTFSSL